MECVETKSPGELRKCVEKAPWQELWSSKGSAGLEAQAWKMGDLIRQAHSPSSLCDPYLPKPIKSLSPCETHPQGSMPRSQWCWAEVWGVGPQALSGFQHYLWLHIFFMLVIGYILDQAPENFERNKLFLPLKTWLWFLIKKEKILNGNLNSLHHDV